MVRLIEAMNYRSLKCVRQPLDEFHVLVGPNASGKSTYMDVLAFLSRLVNDGLDAAIDERGTFDDLCWNRQGQRFELAIEVVLPEEHRRQLHLFRGGEACVIRYELAVAKDAAGTVRIVDEQVLLAPSWDLTEPGSQESVKILEEMALPPGNAYALTARNKGIANTVFTRRGNGFWVPLLTPTKASTEYALSPEFFDPERPDEDQYWAVYRPNGKRPIFGSVSEIEFPSTVALHIVFKYQTVGFQHGLGRIGIGCLRIDMNHLQQSTRPDIFLQNGEQRLAGTGTSVWIQSAYSRACRLQRLLENI